MSRLFSGTPFDRPIVCEICGKAVADCRCIKLPPKKKMSEQPGGRHADRPAPGEYELTPQNATPPQDQRATLRVEKRKGNREVTVISGLEHPANDLPQLLSALKAALGCGGAVAAGRVLELQGDQTGQAAALLEERGIRTRQK